MNNILDHFSSLSLRTSTPIYLVSSKGKVGYISLDEISSIDVGDNIDGCGEIQRGY